MRKITTANNQHMPKINMWKSITKTSKAWKYDVADRTIYVTAFLQLDSLSVMRMRQTSLLKKQMWLQLRKKKNNNDVVLNGDFPLTVSEDETSETPNESDISENEKNKKTYNNELCWYLMKS